MHKIDGLYTTAVLPTPAGVGTAGYFTKGDPVGGTPATIVTDDWLNAVQQELVNVIVGAGLTLDKTSQSQLLNAIYNLCGVGTTVSKTFGNSPYTATRAGKQIKVDTSGGAVLVNLPAASTCDGERFTIIKTTADANQVTIDANGSELINNDLVQTLDTQWALIEIVSIGTGWVIL